MPKLIRITTVPMALHVLLKGQMRYMKEKGFDVIMVSADGREREAVLADEGCPHVIIPMTRQITPFRDLVALWRLTRFFLKHQPDIIHSHTPKAGLLAMMAGKFAGVKIRIHTVAGLRFMTMAGFKRKLLVQMEKITGRFATHVWPNSFSLETYIREHQLVSPKKLEVIGKGSSNGINLQRYSPAALNPGKLEAIKKQVGYDPQFTYLLCVGRIVKDKGIDELVRAFARIHAKNPSVRLLLVGDFEDELDPVSEETRRMLKTHPGVIMPGWSEDVAYFMPLAFALLHPSHREGFPNVVLQAGAMGCPVICSAIEGNVDMVDHGQTGLLFEVRNEEALFQQVQFALAHPQEMKECARRLREKIEQYFDQQVVHHNIYTRYRQLLPEAG